MPKSKEGEKKRSSQTLTTNKRIDKKDRAAKDLSGFRRFSPTDFEKWTKLPRARMIEEIRDRNGMKHYPTKRKRSGIKWPKPIQITVRGRVGYPGSYRFNLKAPGKKPLSLGIKVDIPIPTAAQMRSNPRWWRESEHASEIDTAIVAHNRPFLLGLTQRGFGPTKLHLNLLAEALNRGGFSGRHMVSKLDLELGPGFLASLAEKCFLHSVDEAKAYLQELNQHF